MTARRVACPNCGQSEQVDKVSTIYLAGIGQSRLPAGAEPIHVNFQNIPPDELRRLSRRLKPPATSKRAPTRPIHPDMVVVTFSLIIPFFLYGMYESQAGILLPVLALLAVFYGLYLWKRKVIIARFERQVTTGKAAEERVRRGIERWMKLYYCLQDDGVFEVGKTELVPADQMDWYLFKE